METFNTVNELAESSTENKMVAYIKIAKDYADKAYGLLDSERFMTKMSAKEVMSAYRNAEQCDCEYAAYAAAHDAEKWFEKAQS